MSPFARTRSRRAEALRRRRKRQSVYAWVGAIGLLAAIVVAVVLLSSSGGEGGGAKSGNGTAGNAPGKAGAKSGGKGAKGGGQKIGQGGANAGAGNANQVDVRRRPPSIPSPPGNSTGGPVGTPRASSGTSLAGRHIAAEQPTPKVVPWASSSLKAAEV